MILDSEVSDVDSQNDSELRSDDDTEDEYYSRLKFRNRQQKLKKILFHLPIYNVNHNTSYKYHYL